MFERQMLALAMMCRNAGLEDKVYQLAARTRNGRTMLAKLAN